MARSKIGQQLQAEYARIMSDIEDLKEEIDAIAAKAKEDAKAVRTQITARKKEARAINVMIHLAADFDDTLAPPVATATTPTRPRGERKYNLTPNEDGSYDCPHGDGRSFPNLGGITMHITRGHKGKMPSALKAA